MLPWILRLQMKDLMLFWDFCLFFCKLSFPLTPCDIASLLCIFEILTVMWGVGLLWPFVFGVLNSSCVWIPPCFSVWDIFCCNFASKLLVIFNFISALSKSPCLRPDPQIKMAILCQQLWTTCSSLGSGNLESSSPIYASILAGMILCLSCLATAAANSGVP